MVYCGPAPDIPRGRAFQDQAGMATPEDELREMAKFEAHAEQAYDEMYKTRYPIGLYSDLKDFFDLAISAAERAGRPDEAARLAKRREHCRDVYRKHFDY